LLLIYVTFIEEINTPIITSTGTDIPLQIRIDKITGSSIVALKCANSTSYT
jgi:hypothetical protein